MAISFSAPVTHVYITNDGEQGQYASHLRVLRNEMPIREIADTLDLIIENPRERSNDIEMLRSHGRFLIGQYISHEDRRVDKLLYAEAHGLRKTGAFSVVKMAAWAKNKDAEPSRKDTEKNLASALIISKLGKYMLSDINKESHPYGVPVERTTRIASLYPTFYEDPKGYLYGHQADIEAILNLDLPVSLRQHVVEATRAWHEIEIKERRLREF